ncbi:MAG: leucine-rich repeat domain-containing protein [Sodaliphilus sp.]
MRSVVLPPSVKVIGDFAFYDCYSLASIHIPDSVERIGHWAFGEDENLRSIIIPESVKQIGRNAFTRCMQLDNFILLSSTARIGEDLFIDTDCPHHIVATKLMKKKLKKKMGNEPEDIKWHLIEGE